MSLLRPVTLFTVGHSNRSADEFIALLRDANIATLVDVRALPQSRYNPQFSQQALEKTLASAGIDYHWAGTHLGGLREPAAESPHHALKNDAFKAYADHMLTSVFKEHVASLIRLAAKRRTAVMCAEREPEHCHRSLLADYLLFQDCQVVHYIRPGEFRQHQLRPEARCESSQLIYDRFPEGHQMDLI